MSEVKLPSSPYKGLMPFLEKDAPFFFGRERERKIISANLRTRRLTLLYGPSGVGKSSVINAGVVYHLRQRGQPPRPRAAAPPVAPSGQMVNPGRRMGLSDDRPEFVRYRKPVIVIVFNNWIGNPLESLPNAIIANLKESPDYNFEPEAEKNLHTSTLTEILEAVTVGAEAVELLIILDQFEEYFVYHRVDEGVGKFADEFTRAIVNPDLNANFLISIREDWLARLDRFKGRIPNLFENSIRIDHLERAAARDAIHEPIKKYNKLIRDGNMQRPEVVITGDFIFKALDQLELLDEPGAVGLESLPPQGDAKSSEPRIQTPRLQLVLDHLWDKVKNDTPPTLGAELLDKPDTVKRIFQWHLEESLKHLSDKQKMVAANFFRFMITPSGTKFASTAGELALRCGRPQTEIRALLEKLSERKIRVLNEAAPSPGRPHVEPHYEIASDVLADPILYWAHEKRGRQRRKHDTRRKFWIIFIILLLITIGVVASLFLRAREQRREIAAAQMEANAQRNKAVRALNVIRKQDERIPYSKAVLRGHEAPIVSAFFTSEAHVLTASTDGTAILWDIETKEMVREFSNDQNSLNSASSSRHQNLAVTGSLHGRVILWNTVTGESKLLHDRPGDNITDVRFSPNGEFVVAANITGAITIWKVATGEEVKAIFGNNKSIRQLDFSPQGTFLAAASEDHTVRVWKVSDWSERILKGHTEMVNGLAFSPDEKSIATAGADATVRVWNISNGSPYFVGRHTASVNSVTFDRDGKRILTASDDTTARVWKLDNSAKPVELIGHNDKVLSAAFDFTGMQVITGSRDTTARIWVASTGWNLAELRGHLDQVTYVAFAPDGRFVLTASHDATARVWFAPRRGDFNLETPTIDAVPKQYVGPCPVTIRFFVKMTAVSGSGTILYRFRGSDGRIWPIRTQTFNEPGSSYVNWYWRIARDFVGSETIEVIEPKGIKEQKARFTVKCTKSESEAPPQPTPVIVTP